MRFKTPPSLVSLYLRASRKMRVSIDLRFREKVTKSTRICWSEGNVEEDKCKREKKTELDPKRRKQPDIRVSFYTDIHIVYMHIYAINL